jgi:hypothetical protein
MARGYGPVKIAGARRYARHCSLTSHHTRARTIGQMEWINALCRFAEMAEG